MVKKLKYALVFVVALVTLFFGNRADCQNPGEHWQQYKSVEQAGFSSEKLRVAKQYYDSLKSSAFMIVQNGKVVAAWGEINRRLADGTAIYVVFRNIIVTMGCTLPQEVEGKF